MTYWCCAADFGEHEMTCKNYNKTEDCFHCWHLYKGPIWMVIPPGKTLEECCKCSSTRVVSIHHTNGWLDHSPNWPG